MRNKEFKRLNKSELLEVIYRFQLHERELNRELEQWKSKAQERYDKLEQSGSIAQAALSIYEVFTDAQRAADDYVSVVTARINRKEQAAQAALNGLKEIFDSLQEISQDLQEDGYSVLMLQAQLQEVARMLSPEEGEGAGGEA